MLSRPDIRDDHWDRLKNLLPGPAGGHGGVGNNTRLFIDAIRSRAKTGLAWADLPTCDGTSNSPWPRYHRWCKGGVWAWVAAASRDDTEWRSVDRTCVRATGAAARGEKKLCRQA